MSPRHQQYLCAFETFPRTCTCSLLSAEYYYYYEPGFHAKGEADGLAVFRFKGCITIEVLYFRAGAW
jgi:hypothetical protein